MKPQENSDNNCVQSQSLSFYCPLFSIMLIYGVCFHLFEVLFHVLSEELMPLTAACFHEQILHEDRIVVDRKVCEMAIYSA